MKQTTLGNFVADRYQHEPVDLKNDEKESMSIFHWNVNGLNAISKKDCFIKHFQNQDYDIINLSETKMTLERMHKLEINKNQFWYNKYHQYWFFSTKRKGYSGCATFSKIKPLKVDYGIGTEKFDIEGRVITLEYKDFFLVNVYVPNAKPKLARIEERVEFNTLFDEHLKKLREKKMTIIVGDFNVAHNEIDLWKPEPGKVKTGFSK